jgi:hypothetical protein
MRPGFGHFHLRGAFHLCGSGRKLSRARGLLEKAGGIPSPAVLTNEGYTHGRMIGQVERAIVVLIVMGGSLGALAFFFAAKD